MGGILEIDKHRDIIKLIHFATQFNQCEIIDYLIHEGSDVNSRNKKLSGL